MVDHHLVTWTPRWRVIPSIFSGTFSELLRPRSLSATASLVRCCVRWKVLMTPCYTRCDDRCPQRRIWFKSLIQRAHFDPSRFLFFTCFPNLIIKKIKLLVVLRVPKKIEHCTVKAVGMTFLEDFPMTAGSWVWKWVTYPLKVDGFDFSTSFWPFKSPQLGVSPAALDPQEVSTFAPLDGTAGARVETLSKTCGDHFLITDWPSDVTDDGWFIASSLLKGVYWKWLIEVVHLVFQWFGWSSSGPESEQHGTGKGAFAAA